MINVLMVSTALVLLVVAVSVPAVVLYGLFSGSEKASS